MDHRAAAAFSNSLGVYEIDEMGLIRDVRILFNDVGEASGGDLITGVEAGHTLGFFIIADGISFANNLTNTDKLPSWIGTMLQPMPMVEWGSSLPSTALRRA